MQIDPKIVKELRDRTNAGMMDCKRALTEANGDLAKAEVILRTKGIASASKKASRVTKEGIGQRQDRGIGREHCYSPLYALPRRRSTGTRCRCRPRIGSRCLNPLCAECGSKSVSSASSPVKLICDGARRVRTEARFQEDGG